MIILFILFFLTFVAYVAYVLISGLASRYRDSNPDIGTRVPKSGRQCRYTDILDLNVCRDNPLVFTYPCHNQTVEHAVATTSGAVSATVKYESKLGNAFTTVDSRTSISGIVTRKKFLL